MPTEAMRVIALIPNNCGMLTSIYGGHWFFDHHLVSCASGVRTSGTASGVFNSRFELRQTLDGD